MSDVVIRRAESNDAPASAAMRWRFKVEDGGDEVPQDEEGFTAECERWLRSRMAGPWRVWLAEVGGQPCGHVFVCLMEKVPSPYPGSDALGYVTDFYVTPEQRNRGLGKALLDEITRDARAHAAAQRRGAGDAGEDAGDASQVIRPFASASAWSRVRTLAQVPSRCRRRNRSWTRSHGP
ncbi:GNAT family N-acetyltransferase [Streptomyces sp. NPDC051310]|uniref:GNAT family N-acetyltransferase n=1 Tax=Streptomyces sp. NPDC051310 TaxID=3365649 RepID=UPI00378EBED3